MIKLDLSRNELINGCLIWQKSLLTSNGYVKSDCSYLQNGILKVFFEFYAMVAMYEN